MCDLRVWFVIPNEVRNPSGDQEIKTISLVMFFGKMNVCRSTTRGIAALTMFARNDYVPQLARRPVPGETDQ